MKECITDYDYIRESALSVRSKRLIKNEGIDTLIFIARDLLRGTFLEPAGDLFVKYQDFYPSFFFSVGPVFSFEEGCLHEVAHAIQMKKERYHLLSVGRFYDMPDSSKVHIAGRSFYEPVTCEPTIMECETVAIQLHLLEELGYDVDHEKFFDSWANTLLNGALPDFISTEIDGRAMVIGFMSSFYLAWDGRRELMNTRLKNFINCVKSLSST